MRGKTMKKMIKTAAAGAMILIAFAFVSGCSHDPVGTTGTSISGYTMAVRANPSEIRANGSDTALIVIEVWDENGNFVDGETVNFAVTSGSLESDSVTTKNGVAINTFTSASADGMAVVTASVENIVVKVDIVQYYTTR